MQPLPVPPLRQTLATYLDTVRPLVGDEQFAVTTRLAREFEEGPGAELQQQLMDKAESTAAEQSNWFADDWVDGYLAEATPLPLSTNVAFEMLLPGETRGTERAAEVIHRLAAVHLAHLRGGLPPEVDPRGTELSAAQRVVLAGGLRVPGVPFDTVEPGNTNPALRYALLIVGAGAFLVPVSDREGQPLPPAAIRRDLHKALNVGAPRGLPDSTVGSTQGDPPPFGGWSYLGARRAMGYNSAICAKPGGSRTLARVGEALFVVTLTEAALPPEQHLHELAFAVGAAYPTKPLSYRIGLTDSFVGVHMQHSHADGATVVWLSRQAGEVQLPSAEPAGRDPSSIRLQRLGPPLGSDLSVRLTKDLYEYARWAAELVTENVIVPVADTSGLPFPATGDGLAQVLMAFAQSHAYGRIDNTYEAVDMRGYLGGRTDAIRPVTVEMVALVRALQSNTATLTHLSAASEQHRNWIKRVKSGNGIARHLLALQLLARRSGVEVPLFEDEAYARLTTDALSTSSLGANGTAERMVFAPTSVSGLGVNYTPRAGEVEYLVTGTGTGRDVQAFAEGLREGGRRLAGLIERATETG